MIDKFETMPKFTEDNFIELMDSPKYMRIWNQDNLSFQLSTKFMNKEDKIFKIQIVNKELTSTSKYEHAFKIKNQNSRIKIKFYYFENSLKPIINSLHTVKQKKKENFHFDFI